MTVNIHEKESRQTQDEGLEVCSYRSPSCVRHLTPLPDRRFSPLFSSSCHLYSGTTAAHRWCAKAESELPSPLAKTFLEKNVMPELQTHSFGNSASPFPTFLHLFSTFPYASRTHSKARHWKTTRNRLNRKGIAGIVFRSRNRPQNRDPR
jgi:hypothetical protein